MIQCKLFGHDDVHDVVIELPAVPRAGDQLDVPKLTHQTMRINQVRFTAFDNKVVLVVEWV